MSKWIKCKNCDEKYSIELTRCPFCGTHKPLPFWNKCAIILVTTILMIVIGGIVLGFMKKHLADGSSSDDKQNITSTESENDDSLKQSDSEVENSKNEITESNSEPSNNESEGDPTTMESEDESEKNNTSTTTKPQEQKPTTQIPEDKINGVKTTDIVLPAFYDATEGLKKCRDWYRPLSFIVLTSAMDEMVSDYNDQYSGEYILEVGGNIDKVMIYTYRIRFDFADVSGARAKFEKHLDDNAEFFKSQLALYKEYASDVTGIQVIFEHDESNQTLTTRTFK